MAMPDRIWAGSVLIDGGFIDGKVALPVWDTDKSGRPWVPTEFIRADLVDELVKALEPFVALGNRILSEAPQNAARLAVFTDCEGETHSLEFTDIRAAKAALTRIKGDGK